MKRSRGVTLLEILVSAGLLGLVLTAVISFYVRAIAVSSKRNENSERLRRFHLGLEKAEQVLQEGKIIDLRLRSILFLRLDDQPGTLNFPLFQATPGQLASCTEGLLITENKETRNILPTKDGENVTFSWIKEDTSSDSRPNYTVLSIDLYHSGLGKRSDLFFHHTVHVSRY